MYVEQGRLNEDYSGKPSFAVSCDNLGFYALDRLIDARLLRGVTREKRD